MIEWSGGTAVEPAVADPGAALTHVTLGTAALGLATDRPLEFEVSVLTARTALIDGHCLRLEICNSPAPDTINTAAACVSDLRTWLFDAISSKVLLSDSSDFLLVYP